MGVSQVVFEGSSLVDLTQDTVTPESLLQGYTAHAANGAGIVGTASGGGDIKNEDDQLLLFSNSIKIAVDTDYFKYQPSTLFGYSFSNFNKNYNAPVEIGNNVIDGSFLLFDLYNFKQNVYLPSKLKSTAYMFFDTPSMLIYNNENYPGLITGLENLYHLMNCDNMFGLYSRSSALAGDMNLYGQDIIINTCEDLSCKNFISSKIGRILYLKNFIVKTDKNLIYCENDGIIRFAINNTFFNTTQNYLNINNSFRSSYITNILLKGDNIDFSLYSPGSFYSRDYYSLNLLVEANNYITMSFLNTPYESFFSFFSNASKYSNIKFKCNTLALNGGFLGSGYGGNFLNSIENFNKVFEYNYIERNFSNAFCRIISQNLLNELSNNNLNDINLCNMMGGYTSYQTGFTEKENINLDIKNSNICNLFRNSRFNSNDFNINLYNIPTNNLMGALMINIGEYDQPTYTSPNVNINIKIDNVGYLGDTIFGLSSGNYYTNGVFYYGNLNINGNNINLGKDIDYLNYSNNLKVANVIQAFSPRGMYKSEVDPTNISTFNSTSFWNRSNGTINYQYATYRLLNNIQSSGFYGNLIISGNDISLKNLFSHRLNYSNIWGRFVPKSFVVTGNNIDCSNMFRKEYAFLNNTTPFSQGYCMFNYGSIGLDYIGNNWSFYGNNINCSNMFRNIDLIYIPLFYPKNTSITTNQNVIINFGDNINYSNFVKNCTSSFYTLPSGLDKKHILLFKGNNLNICNLINIRGNYNSYEKLFIEGNNIIGDNIYYDSATSVNRITNFVFLGNNMKLSNIMYQNYGDYLHIKGDNINITNALSRFQYPTFRIYLNTSNSNYQYIFGKGIYPTTLYLYFGGNILDNKAGMFENLYSTSTGTLSLAIYCNNHEAFTEYNLINSLSDEKLSFTTSGNLKYANVSTNSGKYLNIQIYNNYTYTQEV